jgi:ABC-type amino acid transport substrate-binding protein
VVPWPDPPPGPKPPRTTRVWTALRALRRTGWLRPRRVGCLLLVLLALLFAALWALSAAVNGTVAMFRNDPPPETGSPFDNVAPRRPASTGSPTIDRITRHGKIIVAVQQVPGFAEPASLGRWSGFDVALVDLLAKDLGVDPINTDFVPFTTTSPGPALQRGDFDIAAGGYQITAQQRTGESIAGPYLVRPLRLVVPADSAVTGLDSLGDGKVCAPKDSPAADQLADRLGARLTTRSTLGSCANLLGGRVDAIAGDQSSVDALPGVKSGKLREVGEPVGSTEYGIALPPGDELFRQRVTEVLRRAIEDGTWAKLYAQYLGTPVPAPPVLPR